MLQTASTAGYLDILLTCDMTQLYSPIDDECFSYSFNRPCVYRNAVLAGEKAINADRKTRADEEETANLSELSQKISSTSDGEYNAHKSSCNLHTLLTKDTR